MHVYIKISSDRQINAAVITDMDYASACITSACSALYGSMAYWLPLAP